MANHIHLPDPAALQFSLNGANDPSAVLLSAEEQQAIQRALGSLGVVTSSRTVAQVTRLPEQKFSIELQGEGFVVKQHQGSYIAIRTKRRWTIVSSIKNLFHHIVQLFYGPSFPHPAMKERSSQEAVRQDYRSLRKGLEQGLRWLEADSSPVETKKDLRQAIANSQRVEKVLYSSSPRQKLEQLSNRLAAEINQLRNDGGQAENNKVVITSGYLTADRVLQPILIEFVKQGDRIQLELFNDPLEGGERVNPLQKRLLARETDASQIEQIVFFLLEPLLQSQNSSQTPELAKPSLAFEQLYEQQRAALLAERAVQQPLAKAVSEGPIDSSEGTLSYIALLQQADHRFANLWQLPVEAVPPSRGLRAPSRTPLDRLRHYLEQLAGGSLPSKGHRASLELVLVEEWVGDQLRQLKASTPLKVQLRLYQESLASIERAIHRTLGSEVAAEHYPPDLLALKVRCEEQIAQIAPKVRREQVVAIDRGLHNGKSAQLPAIPASPPVSRSDRAEIGLEPMSRPVDRRAQISAAALKEWLEQNQVEWQLARAAIDSGVNIEAWMAADNRREWLIEQGRAVLVDLIKGKSTFEEREDYRGYTEADKRDFFYKIRRQVSGNKEIFSEKIIKGLLYVTFFEGDCLRSDNIINYENSDPDLDKHLSKFIDGLKKAEDATYPAEQANDVQALRKLMAMRSLLKLSTGMNVPSPNRVSEHAQNLSERMEKCADESKALLEAAYHEPHSQHKRRLLQEAQETAFEALKLLPAPGSEQAFGEPSIWRGLTVAEQEKFEVALLQLQRVIWEAQLKLGQSTLSPTVQLQLIKAQLIQQTFLFERAQGDPQAWLVDLNAINQFLSQELTAQLSADPTREQELMSLYQCVARSLPQCLQSQNDPEGGFKPRERLQALYQSDGAPYSSLKESIARLGEATYLYAICSDPDSLLSLDQERATDAFFDAHDGYFFDKQPLELTLNLEGEIGKAAIRCSREALPVAFVDLDTLGQQGKRVPFLPVVENNLNLVVNRRLIPNKMVQGNYETWVAYVHEKAKREELSLDAATLQRLFQIRQAADGFYNHVDSTSYQSDTAVRAFSFLTDPHNLHCLQQESVQQFLDESLFGSFLMQQALVEHPQLLASYMKQMQAQLAAARRYPEVHGYLLQIVAKMKQHASLTVELQQRYGWFAAPFTSSLPIYVGREAGTFYPLLQKRSDPQSDHLSQENRRFFDASVLNDPLRHKIGSIHKIIDQLAQIEAEEPSLQITLWATIDQVKETQLRKRRYELLIDDYQRRLSSPEAGPLASDDFVAIFCGCREVGRAEVQGWLHQQILPLFQALPQPQQQQCLDQLALKWGASDSSEGGWEVNPHHPTLYHRTAGEQTLSLDLYWVTLVGQQRYQERQEQVQIPSDLLKKSLVRSALKADRILAQKRSEGETVTYSWNYEGQAFSLIVKRGERLEIRRQWEGKEYIYQPLALQAPNSPATTLLQENGVWWCDGQPHLFVEGMKPPSPLDRYRVVYEDGQFTRIQAHGQPLFVSATALAGEPSPFPFAQSDQLVVLLDERQVVSELRLKGSPLRWKRENGHWKCYSKEKLLGELSYGLKAEKELADALGEDWEQWAIPLKQEEGKMGLLLLPYRHSTLAESGWKVEQDLSSALGQPEKLQWSDDGQVEGSPVAHLYLAHLLLLKASRIANPEVARQMHLRAERHLDKLKGERPATDDRSLQGLSKLIERIVEQPTVALVPMASREKLAMSLRLLLQLRRLQAMAKPALHLSPKVNYELLELMGRQWGGYRALQAPVAGRAVVPPERIDKQLLGLTPAEERELKLASQQLLTHLLEPQEGLAELFGGQMGTLERRLEIARPTHVEASFLLALLRRSKKEGGESSIGLDANNIPCQMNLETLLDHYWTILSSIKRESLKPEQLLFLFNSSILPPTQNRAEVEQLQAIDRQARQFLLAMADLQTKVTELSNPAELLGGSLEEKKRDFSLFVSAAQDLLEGHSDLQADLRLMELAVQAIQLEKIGKVWGDRTIEVADLGKLQSHIQSIRTKIHLFSEKLCHLDQKLGSASSAEEEREQKAKAARLQPLVRQCDRLQKEMNQLLDEAKKGNGLLNGLEVLEALFVKMNNASWSPQPNLAFPEGEKVILQLQEWLTPDEAGNLPIAGKPPMELLNELFRKVGLVDTISLVRQMGEYEQAFDKLKLFAPLLEGLALLPSLTLETAPIAVGNRQLPADQQLEIDLEKVQRLYGSEESKKIADYARGLAPEKRKAYLSALAEALDRNEQESLAVEAALATNIERIEALYNRAQSVPPSTPVAENVFRPDAASEVFQREFSRFFGVDVPSDIPTGIAQAGQLDWKSYLTQIEARQGEWKSSFFEREGNKPAAISLFYCLEWIEKGRKFDSSRPVANELMVRLKNIRELSEVLLCIGKYQESLEKAVMEAEHRQLIGDLKATIPTGERSLYAQDLQRGFAHLEDRPPLPYVKPVRTDSLPSLRSAFAAYVAECRGRLDGQKRAVLSQLYRLPVFNLPKELKKLRLQKVSEERFLQVAYECYKRGAFAIDPELDRQFALCLTEETRLKLLTSARSNGQQALHALEKLDQERSRLLESYQQAIHGADREAIYRQLQLLDGHWKRESSKLRDCLEKGQKTDHLQSLPEGLKPHLRKIIYWQYRLGIALRTQQIEALERITTLPCHLEQLLMGEGKTSTLIPLALDILAGSGYNAIGMVPQAQFSSNFDEMDETTRLASQLSCTPFLFSRQEASLPLTTLSLYQLSEKCGQFFDSLATQGYILTTIESKASLDNKIAELEKRHKELLLSKDPEGQEHPERAAELFRQAVQLQMALDMLYRVKGVFEDREKSRLIIDEADLVARATYSVNAEIGKKESPSPLLCQTVEELFGLIRKMKGTEEGKLAESILANQQFTLSDTEVDELLRLLGKKWLERHPLPLEYQTKQGDFLDWLSGGKSPLSVQEWSQMEIAYKNQLKVLRRALNSALRGSLALKVGLTTAYDPVRKAIGVPAQQGITSATTKFSDPLTQLCLSHMLAFFAPQGESFLRSVAPKVMQKLLDESAKGAEEAALFEKGAEELNTFFERRRAGEECSLADLLNGQEPWQIVLRLEFAQQASHQLIYVTEEQISRPVQDSLRGSNAVVLTGTGTRNMLHIVGEEGMSRIDAVGRTSTAQALYRLAKASPDGLKSAVHRYRTQSEGAIEDFRELAKLESGYGFLVNQAAAGDGKSQKQIVEALHQVAGRPIIFLDIETGKKSVLIAGQLRQLARLSPDEQREVAQAGFYYYHAPHTRGTHFDIPSGFKGALFLSDTVNANDRDQAIYRARKIGEGHQLELFISERQYEQLQQAKKDRGASSVTLEDLLPLHYRQTCDDEEQENLPAYRLHLRGLVKQAVEESKKQLQLASSLALAGKSPTDERYQQELAEKAELFALFESFFSHTSGNERYLDLLEQELFQGGEEAIQPSIAGEIAGQLRLVEMLLGKVGSQDRVKELLTKAKALLEAEKEKVVSRWESISSQLPGHVAMRGACQETSEVEAEQEAQEEQQAESTQESEGLQRKRATEDLFRLFDRELFEECCSRTRREGASHLSTAVLSGLVHQIAAGRGTPVHEMIARYWTVGGVHFVVSKRIDRLLQSSLGGDCPEIQLIVVENEVENRDQDIKRKYVLIVDPVEGHLLGSTIPLGYLAKENRATVRLGSDANGQFSLTYQSAGLCFKGFEEEFLEAAFQAPLLMSLLYLGMDRLTEEQWTLLHDYVQPLDQEGKKPLLAFLKERFERHNPAYLQKLIDRLALGS